MRVNTAISNLIREAKTHQIDNVIKTSAQDGMISMDTYILRLLKNGDITPETAMSNSTHPDQMERLIKG
jgi:twitching motility protein PilT